MKLEDIDLEDGPEAILQCLGELARKHDPSSEYFKALETAGHAILYVYEEGVMKKFAEFLARTQITPEQREHLKSMGLDPAQYGESEGKE